MSTALDDFERTLVAASHRLDAERGVADVAGVGAADALAVPLAPPAASGRRRALPRLGRRLRSLGVAGQVALAAVVCATAAGAATAGWLLLREAPARSIPSYECQVAPKVDAIVDAVTGSPLVDCAAAWPSATGGRTAAPPLAGWVDPHRRLAAVVRPVARGAPGPDWTRLPTSWTVRLPRVILGDQLQDVSLPLNRGCVTAPAAVAQVRALLTADHLRGWTVAVRAAGSGPGRGAVDPAACAPTQPWLVTGRTVVLQRSPVSAAASLPPAQRRALRVSHRLVLRLHGLQARVDATLARECASVDAAAALWTRTARSAGLRPATLADFRAANRSSARPGGPPPYTLYRQPASQHTGRCARVLVMTDGGGAITVYAARLTP